MEMIALGAALGAGVGGMSAANKGENPLTGALLGGATGAAGGALGGAMAPAAGAAGSSAAQAFPVAMDAAIPAVALDGASAAIMPATAEWAAPHLVSGSLIPDMAAMDAAMASGQIAQTAGVTPPISANPLMAGLKGAKPKEIMAFAQQAGGIGGQPRQQMDMRAPQIKQASAPQIAAPIVSLLQERERNPRRRLSLI